MPNGDRIRGRREISPGAIFLLLSPQRFLSLLLNRSHGLLLACWNKHFRSGVYVFVCKREIGLAGLVYEHGLSLVHKGGDRRVKKTEVSII